MCRLASSNSVHHGAAVFQLADELAQLHMLTFGIEPECIRRPRVANEELYGCLRDLCGLHDFSESLAQAVEHKSLIVKTQFGAIAAKRFRGIPRPLVVRASRH